MEYRDHTKKSYVAEHHPEVLTQGYHYNGGDPLPSENARAEAYFATVEDSEGTGDTEEVPEDPVVEG